MKHTVGTGRQVLSWRPVVFFAIAIISIGCYAPTKQAAQPSFDRYVLTRDEIMSSTANQGDLLQAITSLRPNFLANPRVSTPGSSSSSPLVVYIERIQQASLEALRSISADRVAEVRYLEPVASQAQFGSKAAGGALIVRLYRPTDPPQAAGDAR